MAFNSVMFLYFAVAVLILYWAFNKKVLLQNSTLLIASYYFYGQLHYSLPLYLLSLTLIGFFSAHIIKNAQQGKRKLLLIISLVLASCCLVVLKYANFIVSAISSSDSPVLHVLVPVGLSFYTFSTIGYIVDVYRSKTVAEKNFITYGAYISFFAYLLAGPIPTSTEVLPQFKKKRTVNAKDIEDAAGQIIWGLFKKMVIADNIGLAVNYCFANANTLNSITLYCGIVLFSFQIYADFSGYSEIARGIAKLFGINLFHNFKLPFFSRNPGEFWRRWHISLMRWLSSYIYVPLGGRSDNKIKYIAILLFTFTFSGLWHGANWTFVLWGLLNGLYFLPYVFTKSMVRYKEEPGAGRFFPSWKEAGLMFLTFNLITLSRVLFKAKNLPSAVSYYEGLFTNFSFGLPGAFILSNLKWCLLLIAVEWIQRSQEYILDLKVHRWLKFAIYLAVVILIIFFHKKHSLQEYYYFRF